MKKTLFFFLIFLSISNAWADNQQSQKLAQKLPPNFGRVAFGDSGTITYFVRRPKQSPKAIIFSMQGSNGCLYGKSGRVRSEEILIANKRLPNKHPSIIIKWVRALSESGFLVVVPNCPDVRHKSTSEEYAVAIRRIIHSVNEAYKLPVFLAGESRGTIRIVNVASRFGSEIRGIVLLSTLTRYTREATVFDLPYKKISSSVLMIIHKRDGCVGSESLSLLKSFSKDLVLVKDKVIKVVEGGQESFEENRAALCGSESHHGMMGIHEEVISLVTRWVQERLN
jgi:predicted alpha/beta hydrolase family esterase